MRLIWTPPEGEKREYVFKPYDEMSPTAEAVELVGGEAWTTYDEFVRLFQRGNRRALRAALWVCRRREGEPGLRFEQLVLRAGGEVRIEEDDDELAVIRENIRSNPDLDDETKASLLRAYGDEEPVGAPKAQRSDSRRRHPATERGDASTAG